MVNDEIFSTIKTHPLLEVVEKEKPYCIFVGN
jgi:hypothetical protein